MRLITSGSTSREGEAAASLTGHLSGADTFHAHFPFSPTMIQHMSDSTTTQQREQHEINITVSIFAITATIFSPFPPAPPTSPIHVEKYKNRYRAARLERKYSRHNSERTCVHQAHQTSRVSLFEVHYSNRMQRCTQSSTLTHHVFTTAAAELTIIYPLINK